MITFDQLPQAVQLMAEQMNRIEALLISQQPAQLADIMSIDEVAALLGLAKGTIFQKVYKAEIPHFKQGRKLRFSRADIEAWIRETKVSTSKELFNLKYKRQ